MKKTFYLILPFIIISLGYAYPTNLNTPDPILKSISIDFHNGMSLFGESIDNYLEIAKDTGSSPEELRQAHLICRNQFKKIELLFEYLDGAGTKQRINGAPLPKTEQKVSELVVLQPKGLQILDELTFEDEIDRDQITKLLKTLKTDYTFMQAYQEHIIIQHYQVFEAARIALIRIFALGVTGFDTPGSVNAMEEAAITLESLASTLSHYISLTDGQSVKIFDKINDQIEMGLHLISMSDFESFDRLAFLTSCINPLYENILLLQLSIGIETPDEVNQLPSAINYAATNLFDQDFLNKDFYSGLVPELKNDRIQLGKKLFYDPILSSSLNMSCSSCHEPTKYFTDQLPTSVGSKNGHLMRNSPTLINSVYAEKYFYDLREELLEKQIAHVVTSHDEFDTDYIEIMEKLSADSNYVSTFAKAYPEQKISTYSVANSLAHYVSSLSSFESEFDLYARGEINSYPDDARRGFNLFMGKAACGTCHFAPTFNGLVPPLYQESESEVLGVPETTKGKAIDGDIGRIANARPLDEAEIYRHAFKTTTVRNIEHTGPYMHNGVYASLEEVMDFYNHGGGLGMGLDVPNQTLAGDSLHLNTQEISDIISFMKTLTDEKIIAAETKELHATSGR